MVTTQAIIIDELTVELEETKRTADMQRQEYESQLMSQRTYRETNDRNQLLTSDYIERKEPQKTRELSPNMQVRLQTTEATTTEFKN